jgi:hypothetical protein
MIVALAACDADGNNAVPDAPASVTHDADTTVRDAPYTCTPIAPRAPGPACLALAPAPLQGATPFGDLDLALTSFAAADCITISIATITWTGACGEQLIVQFSYPVHATESGKRRVTTSFDRDARFMFRPPGMAMREDVATVHVDVTTWQEGQDLHDLDITLTVTDPAYTLPPLRMAGTFCEWASLLC